MRKQIRYPEVSAVTKSLQLDPANIVFVPIPNGITTTTKMY